MTPVLSDDGPRGDPQLVFRGSVQRPPGLSRRSPRMSVSLHPRGEKHRVVPQPCGLFTLMETRNLIWQDGSVLLPLPCAAGSPPRLPFHLPGLLTLC